MMKEVFPATALLLLFVVATLQRSSEAFVGTALFCSTRVVGGQHRLSSKHPQQSSLSEVAKADKADDVVSFQTEEQEDYSRSRRALVTSTLPLLMLLATQRPAAARWILDDDTGEFVEVDDVDWQTAWKERLDKASTMTSDEIFAAARGAGNVVADPQEESPASRKRRALSACRNNTLRSQAGAGTEQECTARVLNGKEVDFILTPPNGGGK
mmetsp:Transcript_19344/g.36519  ORF Transcript_19344/g.36519 Transcript_19344/m.36519 type:complete len:212 (-) Transcript_19344:131-766(-)|eukprot:scaffold19_cov169-Amphora_coffeaeformis.AAC.3